MSRRIFQTPSDPSPSTDNGRTPNCYYHKHPITHFCTQKKCTLPLCTECLPIHKKKHIKYKQMAMEGIVDFEAARGEALKAFKERKIQIQGIQQKFLEKVAVYRKQIQQCVSAQLQKIIEDCLIEDGNAQILQQIQERSSQIRSGSLKQMIRYYEDSFGAEHSRKVYKMYFGDYLNNVKFQINRSSLQQSISKGILNMSTNRSSKRKIEKENVQPPKNELQYEPTSLQETLLRPNGIEFEMVKQPQRVNRKDEDLESEISTYKVLKSKKNSSAQINIYTRNVQPLTSAPLSSFPSSSNTSRSKSRRKKGLSLARSHQHLPLDTRGSFQSQQPSQEQSQKRTSWKNFINMGGTVRGQHPRTTRQEVISQIQTNPIMDPRQMRQMIMRKKVQEKNKQMTNKPVEHLLP